MAIALCTPVRFRSRIFNPIFRRTREAFVIVDPAERKKKIEEEMIEKAAKVSGRSLKTKSSSMKSRFLVEYPVALCGSFDRQFLSLPQEVLIHSMKEHQRYFPVVDEHGKLLPHFVCISNINPKDRNVVVKGNEKVLKARLSDAAFFFQDDLKIPSGEKSRAIEESGLSGKTGDFL